MPEIETLMLANHAEAVNGLLYISGGGWTDHWRGTEVGDQAPISSLGVAVGILVPWGETNRRHELVIRIEGEDGHPELARLDGDYEVGRPPGSPPGIDQRAVVALNANVQFPTTGGYRIVAESGGSARSVSFRVHDTAPPPHLRNVG